MYVSPLKGVRPFARLNLSLVSRILLAHSHIYYLRAHLALLYVARLNDTKVTHDIYAVFFFLSFVSSRTFFFHSFPLSLSLSRAHSYSRSFSLSNTGRVLSDKNSSLNKHMIQKLLSYRLTASVKRIVYFFIYLSYSSLLSSFSLFPSLSPPSPLCISLSFSL